MDQRLTALERKISHQDKLLDELNAVVFAQAKRIDQLDARLKAMNDQISNRGDLVKRQEDETPPPHY